MLNLENLLNKQCSRRQALIGMGLGISSVALRGAFAQNPKEKREGLTPINNVVNFDFVSQDNDPYTVSFNYFNYLETKQEIETLVGPEYNMSLTHLVWDYWRGAMREGVGDAFKHEVTTDYPEYGLVAGGMLSFASHGWRVAEMQKRFARRYGYDFIPQVYPVQPGISIKDLHAHDSLGNPSVLLHMSAEPIKEQLRELPDQKIVNISLQFGTLAIIHKRKKVNTQINEKEYNLLQNSLLTFYKLPDTSEYCFYNPQHYYIDEQSGTPQLKSRATDEPVSLENPELHIIHEDEYQTFTTTREREILQETLQIQEVDTSQNPYYEITGAYRDTETGRENIQELFSLVNEFPDKLFIVAAGNYGDDLEPLREQFAGLWPENLIIAGHWDSKSNYPKMYNAYDIFGADIYFDARTIGGDNGSSFATATLSSAASLLESKGSDIYQIKQLLLESCDMVEIEKVPTVSSGSTNIEDYIQAYMNKKKETVRVFNIQKFHRILDRMNA